MAVSEKKLGEIGEKIAEDFLKKKRYRILERNFSARLFLGPRIGEIDIVAEKDGIISFAEVKTLSQTQGNVFSPEEKVNFQKQKKTY